ncbi:MAG: hypothetical protein GY835_09760 [bacterium]|nr:hypothetical protein [bacterium]
MRTAYAFTLGCSTAKWSNRTTIEQQHAWVQTVQEILLRGKSEIERLYEVPGDGSSLFIPRGDGGFVAFLSSVMIDAPFKLAVYLTSRAREFPCNIRMALNSGLLSMIRDEREGDHLSGEGLDSTERLLCFADCWEIVVSSSYAQILGSHDKKLRTLFSSTPRTREDHKGKMRSFHYLEGTHKGIQLGSPNRVLKGMDKQVLAPAAVLPTTASLLLEIPSWLSEKRKQEIVESYRDYVDSGKLRAHRKQHYHNVKQKWTKTSDSFMDPAWNSLATANSPAGYRLIIGFKNRGCDYRRREPLGIGCFHCGFYAGAQPPPKNRARSALRSQLLEGLRYGRQHGGGFDVIEFSSDGSFLSDYAMPRENKDDIIHAVRQMPQIKRILIESTPDNICGERKEILRSIEGLRDDQELEIGIGLETADEFIRQACLNKGVRNEDFETAVGYIQSLPPSKRIRIRIVVYILVKPPWLSECESINDVVRTIDYLHKIGQNAGIRIIPKLEPAIISEGTLLSLLWHDGLYSPLNYWAILETLARIHFHDECHSMLQRVRVGTRGDMDESTRIPGIYRKDGRFDRFDFVLYRALQEFSQHGNLARVFGLVAAAYQAKESSILDSSQSLAGWLGQGCPTGDSAIIKYLKESSGTINEVINDVNLSGEIEYISRLFDVLDRIENHNGETEGSSFRSLVLDWKGELQNAQSIADTEKTTREIEEEINLILHSQLSYSQARVDEVFVEKEGSQVFRIRISVMDLLRGGSHEIWAGIPTQGRL